VTTQTSSRRARLIDNPDERDDYANLKRALAQAEATTTAYTMAKEPWLARALERAGPALPLDP